MEMQIKTQQDAISNPLGWLLLKKKKQKRTSVVEYVEKLDPLCIVGEI